MPISPVKNEPRHRRRDLVGRFFRDLGSGLITGAADDDPSGISTYSVAGTAYGYAGLWTALFSFPLMAAVQWMCARGRPCLDRPLRMSGTEVPERR